MGNDPFAYEIDDDIHHYSKKIAWTKSRLGQMFEGQVGIRFLEKLQLVGLSNARLCYYGDRITNILKEFEKLKVNLADSTKQHCETVLSIFISRDYKGETKIAYALALQRLVHFAKTGEIGDKKSGYVQEVQWISPSRYRDKNGSVHRKDLLTLDEFLVLVSKTTNKRDRAMLWVMYEGAFRPGELLNIRVGGIDFQNEYTLVSTYGKTAQKSVALVVSFRPLLEWLGEHPLRDDPNAPEARPETIAR